jgi:arylsulfatase A-like enzyme
MEPGSFRGVIGRDYLDSTPWWPEPLRARQGTPNVMIVVLDDVGFAQLGCFGSDIDTPVLDGLASGGLRFTNFHTTALCSPTRACVLTGRNHHSNGMGRIVELATGFPGYDARIPKANGFLSEMLLPLGYATFAVGKWHLTPDGECNMAARRDRWPLGRGFERFYGFMEGETHQFLPALVSDNHQLPPRPAYDESYHLTGDLVDQATDMVRDLRTVDPHKPFFMWFCTGACHAPHQAPSRFIDRYRGHFDGGWDAWRAATFARQLESGLLPPGTEMSPRPDWVPAWDSLSDDERRVYVRFMEAFAGFLTHTDEQIGRLLSFLEETGDYENTLLFVLSDNGASSEGGPTGSVNDGRLWNGAPRTVPEALARIDEIGGPLCHNNYPWGWTVAGNTPFKRWKRETHEGGVADPLIVHWPAGIRGRGQKCRAYVHAVDLVPTVLDVLGAETPAVLGSTPQSQIEGVSFAECLSDPSNRGRHVTQYYEMFGCRAIYHDGWKAVTFHQIQDTSVSFADDVWELYNVESDPSECHDLAQSEPQRVEQLEAMWWEEARRHQVLPLDNRPFSNLVVDRPPPVPPRARYVYYPGCLAVPEIVAARVRNRSHRIVAEVELTESRPAEGVLLAQGSGLGGWALYVRDGRPAYVHNYVGLEEHHIDSEGDLAALDPGRHVVEYSFTKTGEHKGTGRLFVDGKQVGEGTIRPFTPLRFSLAGAGLTCGYGDGLPVSRTYRAPFAFTGRILNAAVFVDGQPFSDPEGEAQVAIATQ